MKPAHNATIEALILQWARDGLGWEDIAALLDKRGRGVGRDDIRRYVLGLPAFRRRA